MTTRNSVENMKMYKQDERECSLHLFSHHEVPQDAGTSNRGNGTVARHSSSQLRKVLPIAPASRFSPEQNSTMDGQG
jgi:hypothetical protein